MQQFNELSTNERNDLLASVRASLMAEHVEETTEATTEGDPRRGWLIVSDE